MLGEIGYECLVGLWLNVDREETRRSAGTLKALLAGLSNSIGPEFFRAIANDDVEAQAMHAMYQSRKESE